MAANMNRLAAVEDEGVTLGDRLIIDRFGRNTIRVKELKDEIESKKRLLQDLQDASDAVMMFDDDGPLIYYKIGNAFVRNSKKVTQEMLEAAKEALEKEVKGLEDRVTAIQQVLGDLKVQLYAKFGNNINLEADKS